MRIACLAIASLLAGCQPTAEVPAADATTTAAPAATAPVVDAAGVNADEVDVAEVVAPAVMTDEVIADEADAAAAVAATTNARTGRISGTLSFPSEYLPPMRVCAFELAEATPYCVRTGKNQAHYRLEGVPPGDYLVLAFPQEADAVPGGYTGCVRDLSAACRDHDLQPVVVAAGRTTPAIDPADYYADAADWPQEPAR